MTSILTGRLLAMDVFNDILRKNYHFVNTSYKIIMFSPIIMLAANQITITDKEIPTLIPGTSGIIPPSLITNVEYEPPNKSFLSVLDDKNRMIANLKKQLQNQKGQLSFYIKRELDRTKIEEFSESCTPQASEESLPLNLAINKFCRQAGIKTKLSLLHEHMSRLDYKISHLLRDQEFVLRKIVNKLCEFVKSQESSRYADFKAEFGSFITNPLHIDLFDKLLSATVGLSRKLNTFKICCDRMMLIEEERNSIVEQVYSMPVEERINRNYLVGIQMEKAQLENEIRRISRNQAASRHRIKELNVIENILHNLQWELNSSFIKNEESCISKMVKKINSEARVLLEMTKEQKRRFECEISKTKCPDWSRILLYIKAASDGDKMDKKELERCGIKSDDEIRLFEMFKREIDLIKNKVQEEAGKENKKLETECEKLKGQITQVLLDNSRTKVSNSALKQELEELKLERKIGLQRLKQERDAYKSQVEDLQAIREAYAQLVDKQPDTSQMEREFFEQIDDRDRKILDLQNQLSGQNQEIDKLRVRLMDQNDQIVVLNRFINLTRPSSTRESSLPEIQTYNDPCCSKNLKQQRLPQFKEEYTYMIHETKNENTETKSSDNGSYRYRPHNASNTKKIFKGHKHYGVISTVKKKSNKNKCFKYNNSENLSQLKKDKSVTCMKIFSQTNEEINSNVKMEQASLFSMEIKYTNNEIDKRVLEFDEFELFKDCSVESVILENPFENFSRSRDYMN